MLNVKLLPFFVPSALNLYSLNFHCYRRASRMSRPAMLTKFLRRHRRLLSKSWTRASSREARWIRTSWRGVTSCCELMFFAELFICGYKPLTGCRGLQKHSPSDTFVYNCSCCSTQALRERMAEGERWLSGPTQGASETGSCERQQPSAAGTKNCRSC